MCAGCLISTSAFKAGRCTCSEEIGQHYRRVDWKLRDFSGVNWKGGRVMSVEEALCAKGPYTHLNRRLLGEEAEGDLERISFRAFRNR
jgi:hypothetical protein